jgi:hypothetical protein
LEKWKSSANQKTTGQHSGQATIPNEGIKNIRKMKILIYFPEYHIRPNRPTKSQQGGIAHSSKSVIVMGPFGLTQLFCYFEEDYYELNALYYVKEGDLEQFGQAIKECESFYETQQSATGGALKSEQQYLM